MGFWMLDKMKGGKTREYYDQIRYAWKEGSSVEETEKRIQNLIAHAVKTTDFYKDYPETCSLEDLPVVNKDTFRQQYDRFVSSTYKDAPDNRVMCTSGSTGTPLRMIQNRDKIRHNTAGGIFLGAAAGYYIGMKEAFIRVWVNNVRKSKFQLLQENLIMMDSSRMDEKALEEISSVIVPYCPREKSKWFAVKVFERDKKIMEELPLTPHEKAVIDDIIGKTEKKYDDDGESIITGERYNAIADIVSNVVVKARQSGMTTSDKIDRIITNRWFGLPIFAVVMWAVYYISIQTIGAYGTDWANDTLFGELIPEWTSSFLESVACAEWLQSLILDGIIAGVGAVLGFLPQMAVLFLCLGILEDCGYMVRIAFVMDRVFRHFGLSGKSFIPLLISSGCGIPGIMASKTIEQDNDRRLTIMTATFIPCGAKLPVIALMGGVIAGETAGYAESSFIAPLMYFIGIVAVLVAAIILKKTKPFSGKPAPFVMELPPYRLPTAKAIFRHTWEKGAQYLRKMGGIIMIASIVIWALGYYPDHDAYETVAEQQENSYIGQIGKAMEPVIEPLGFDWKLGIGILSGVGAKELVVSTLGVLYTNDAEADAVSLAERIPITPLVAFCYMVFVLIYFPCIATIVAIKQESGSWKWALFTAVYTTLLAWVMAFAIYRIGGLFV